MFSDNVDNQYLQPTDHPTPLPSLVEIGISGFLGGISAFMVQLWVSNVSEISFAALWQGI